MNPSRQIESIHRRLVTACRMSAEARRLMMQATFEVGDFLRSHREVPVREIARKSGVTHSQLAKMEIHCDPCAPISPANAKKVMELALSLKSAKKLSRRDATNQGVKKDIGWKLLNQNKIRNNTTTK